LLLLQFSASPHSTNLELQTHSKRAAKPGSTSIVSLIAIARKIRHENLGHLFIKTRLNSIFSTDGTDDRQFEAAAE